MAGDGQGRTGFLISDVRGGMEKKWNYEVVFAKEQMNVEGVRDATSFSGRKEYTSWFFVSS
jgi:hypothetical protein